MKNKVTKFFHKFLSGFKAFGKRISGFFKKKKKRNLVNHFDEPIYLLFPEDDKDKDIFDSVKEKDPKPDGSKKPKKPKKE